MNVNCWTWATKAHLSHGVSTIGVVFQYGRGWTEQWLRMSGSLDFQVLVFTMLTVQHLIISSCG